MRDGRIATLVRTVEARFPGTKAVVDAYRSPDDPEIRWWIRILHAPRGKEHLVSTFANRLALDLYNWREPPFFVGAEGPRRTREYLARKRAEAARRRIGRARRPSRPRRRPALRRASA